MTASEIPPIAFTWTGKHMMPRDRRADDFYDEGVTYALVPWQGRSMKSHDHLFACLTEAWKNLPEDQFERFPSPEHFRKYLLIKSGHYHLAESVFDTEADAEKYAARVRGLDKYCIVMVSGGSVREYTAQSQSKKEMGRKVFQESKQACLELAAQMIGVTVKELAKHAEAE